MTTDSYTENKDITASREIRVFLSSTFADMQDERDYLVKKIFPAFRRECRRRNVEFTVLDLRWGITEEEAKSGRVIEICMDEISRTRPFFIGLIGGRYGWIPGKEEQALNEHLLLRYPHVRDGIAAGKSITEMEMLYGVLDNPDKTYSAFFIRNLRSVPRKFVDKSGTEHAAKREQLKARIRTAAGEGRCTAGDYSSLKDLGRGVQDFLMSTLDRLYPATDRISRMDAVMASHKAAKARLRRIYVERGDTFGQRLFDGKNGTYALCEPAGYGKSAWIANNWDDVVYLSPQERHVTVIHTMVGNGIESAEMCRRALVYELAERIPGVGIPDLDLPADQKVDINAVLDSLDVDVMWVIDGVERFENGADCSLAWLGDLHGHISKIMVSTSDKELIEAARAVISLEDVHLSPLRESQKMALTAAYLRNFSKSLTASQRALIANDPELASPGTLRIFLNEILQYGIYENLDSFMARYIDAPDMDAFLGVVLDRIEGDFDKDMVSRLFNMLRLSCYGIYEEDMIKWLGLKPVEWAAIYSAVAEFIEVTEGRMSLRKGVFTDVVSGRYPISDKAERRIRKAIIAFSQKRFDAMIKESMDELRATEGLIVLMFSRLTGLKPVSDRLAMLSATMFVEIGNQKLALGMFRDVAKMLNARNFYYGNFRVLEMTKWFRALKENEVSLSSLIGFRDIFNWGVLNETLWLQLYRTFFNHGQEGDREAVARKIRMVPLPRSRKQKLLDVWKGTPVVEHFTDLWDEADFESSIINFSESIYAPLTGFDVAAVEMAHEKLLRTLAHPGNKDMLDQSRMIIYFLLSETSVRLGRHEDALMYFSEQAKLNTNPGFDSFLRFYLDFVIPGRRQYLESDYKAVLRMEENTFGNLSDMADAMLHHEDKAYIRELVRKSFDKNHFGGNIGDILYGAGLYAAASEALMCVSTLTEDTESKLVASNWGGRAAVGARDYNLAVKLLTDSLELIRNNRQIDGWSESGVLYELSGACFNAGMQNEGKRYLNEMISLGVDGTGPESWKGYNNLATRISNLAWKQTGEARYELLRQAIEYHNKALKCNPNHPDVLKNRFATYTMLYPSGTVDRKVMEEEIAVAKRLYSQEPDGSEDKERIAGNLMQACYYLEKWDDVVALADIYQKVNDNNGLLSQHDLFKSLTACGDPKQRVKVVDYLMYCMAWTGKQRLLMTEEEWLFWRQRMEITAGYVEEFDLFEDFGYYIEHFIKDRDELEGIVIGMAYLGAVLEGSRLDAVSEVLFEHLMREFKDAVNHLNFIAKGLLYIANEKIDNAMVEAKVAELKAHYANKVDSAEELRIKELESMELYLLLQPGGMDAYIAEIKDKPWRDRVIERLLERLMANAYDRIEAFLEPLRPFLTAETASQPLLETLDCLLDEVSHTGHIGRVSRLIYPMYISAGLKPCIDSAMYYMNNVYTDEGIDAMLSFYEKELKPQGFDFDLVVINTLISSGRVEEAEKLIDRKLAEKSGSPQYLLREKMRICRNSGRYTETVEIYKRIIALNPGDDFMDIINHWMVASAYTYAGLHEEALAVLEKEFEYMGLTADEADPEHFDAETAMRDENKFMVRYLYAMALRSVIYIRMGNVALGREVFRRWEQPARMLEESGAGELAILALREMELARAEFKAGRDAEAREHADHARRLIEKDSKSPFVNLEYERFLKEFNL